MTEQQTDYIAAGRGVVWPIGIVDNLSLIINYADKFTHFRSGSGFGMRIPFLSHRMAVFLIMWLCAAICCIWFSPLFVFFKGLT